MLTTDILVHLAIYKFYNVYTHAINFDIHIHSAVNTICFQLFSPMHCACLKCQFYQTCTWIYDWIRLLVS